MDDRATDAGEATTGSEDDGASADAEDDRRLWLVERTYTDKGLVSLVYATTDGEYAAQRQRSMNMLQQGADVTAAITVDRGSPESVEDEATRDRYAEEASRMADEHDPDAAV